MYESGKKNKENQEQIKHAITTLTDERKIKNKEKKTNNTE